MKGHLLAQRGSKNDSSQPRAQRHDQKNSGLFGKQNLKKYLIFARNLIPIVTEKNPPLNALKTWQIPNPLIDYFEFRNSNSRNSR